MKNKASNKISCETCMGYNSCNTQEYFYPLCGNWEAGFWTFDENELNLFKEFRLKFEEDAEDEDEE